MGDSCGGTCGCPRGGQCNAGRCPLRTCTTPCKAGESCVDGQCIPGACGAGETQCGLMCCPPLYTCFNGACRPPME
jgi:hypothetical protein